MKTPRAKRTRHKYIQVIDIQHACLAHDTKQKTNGAHEVMGQSDSGVVSEIPEAVIIDSDLDKIMKKYKSYHIEKSMLSQPIIKMITNEFRWLRAIYLRFSLEQHTLFLAYSYMIAFVLRYKKKIDILLVSCVCIIMASKIEEVEVKISIGIILKGCSRMHGFNKKQIENAERLVLHTLDWNCYYKMTPCVYIEIIKDKFQLQSTVIVKAYDNLDSIILCDIMLWMNPTDIGLACVLEIQENLDIKTIEDKHNSVDLQHVINCIRTIPGQRARCP